MMKRRFLATALTLASITLAAPGCGESGPSLVMVSGVVIQNGKPVSDASVLFTPDIAAKDAQPAEDRTGPDGNYTLRTGGRFGVVPGKYHVTIIKAPPAAVVSVANEAFKDDPFMAGMTMKPKPKASSSPDATEFTFEREISAAGPQDFELKTKSLASK